MKRAYDARWRAGEAGRRKAERDAQQRRERSRPAIDWTFTDAGLALASDLSGTGMPAAEVSADGRLTTLSRHRPETVRAALREAMAADPDRVWPDRWRRFAEGE
jgi:hypothetical protein